MYRYWYNYTPKPTKADELSSLIGGIDKDIISELFSLNMVQLNQFYIDYERRYGKTAANYARKNYPLWKSKLKSYNVKSIEKFIQIVPKYFTYEKRYEIIKKLYINTRTIKTYQFEIILGHTDYKYTELLNIFKRLCEIPLSRTLSSDIVDKMNWVCDNDAQLCGRIITAIDAEISYSKVSYALKEFEMLLNCIRDNDNSKMGTHEVNLPYGIITIIVRKPTMFEKIDKFISDRL